VIDDGYERIKYHLNRAYYGLYICPMVWREIDNFLRIGLYVSGIRFYDESDYYRNYEDFIKATGEPV